MIPLFSPNGLEHSLVIPIFIGIVLTHQLVERYGLVFSGLVVPGYLAPILISQPESVAAILIEAMLTYLVARGLHSLSHRTGWLVPVFGRERFFLIIVVALGLRILLESFVFPALVERSAGPLVAAAVGGRFGAIGLIVIPLLANLFWKPGVGRGLAQVGLTTGAVAFVLVALVYPLTNFDLTRLDVVFEDVALDLASSARAQVFLLTGALVASRFNRTQGWDFGGILVPALLSVALLEPLRLLATVGEALAALLLGRFLTAIPPFNRVALTGGRVVLFLFSLVLLLKIGMGWLLHWFDPSLLATDLSGFGYVISALIASKLWTKGTRTTLWPLLSVSVVTFFVATAVSASLAGAGLLLSRDPEGLPAGVGPPPSLATSTLLTTRPDLAPPSRDELLDLRGALREALEVPLRGGDHSRLLSVAGRRAVEVRALALPHPYLSLTRSAGAAALVRTGSRSDLVLSVVGGHDPWGASLVAAQLVEDLGPGVVVAAPPSRELTLRRIEPLAVVLAQRPRRYVLEIVGSADPNQARLDVFGELHDAIHSLRARLPGLRLVAPGSLADKRAKQIGRLAQRGFARLTLGEAAVERFLGGELPTQWAWLHTRFAALGRAPQTQGLDPTLLRLEANLVQRLWLDPAKVRPLALLSQAQALGFQLERLNEPFPGGRRCLILSDASRGRGALLVALDASAGEAYVDVPAPDRYPGSLQAGLQLFLASEARALGVGARFSQARGPSPEEPKDSQDIAQLVHEVLARQASLDGRPPALAIQVRGSRPGLEAQAMFAAAQPLQPTRAADEEALGPWFTAARRVGWTVALVPDDQAGSYDSSGTQAAVLRRARGQGGLSGLWLAPHSRRGLRVASRPPSEAALAGLGFPLDPRPLNLSLGDLSRGAGSTPRELEPLLRARASSESAAFFLTELEDLPPSWSASVLVDPDYGLPLLLLRGSEDRWVLVNPAGQGAHEDLESFLRLRGALCAGGPE